jgi:predicted DNA-binding antitoxin AbrB/MazE fold protein
MELYKVPLAEGEEPKIVLQKAYLKFSTVSSIKESDPNKPA